MSYISVDIEADGPIPGDFSMIALGAVVVRPELQNTFITYIKPISDDYIPDALAISGFSRKECFSKKFLEPRVAMENFADWINKVSKGKPKFIADNNGFDWMFTCWYFQHFLGYNPFGFSSSNLNSLYKGLVKDDFQSFKHLRKTKHTHNPLDDAMGNAEALIAIKNMGMKIKLD